MEGFTFGVLANHTWSYASAGGDDEVNGTFVVLGTRLKLDSDDGHDITQCLHAAAAVQSDPAAFD